MKTHDEEINLFVDAVRERQMIKIVEGEDIKPTFTALYEDNENKDVLKVGEAVAKIDGPFADINLGFTDFVKRKLMFESVMNEMQKRGKIICYVFTEHLTFDKEEFFSMFIKNEELETDKTGTVLLFKIKHDVVVNSDGELQPVGCEFEMVR